MIEVTILRVKMTKKSSKYQNDKSDKKTES